MSFVVCNIKVDRFIIIKFSTFQRSREAVSRQAVEEDPGLDQRQEGTEEAAGQGRPGRQQVYRKKEKNEILILKFHFLVSRIQIKSLLKIALLSHVDFVWPLKIRL